MQQSTYPADLLANQQLAKEVASLRAAGEAHFDNVRHFISRRVIGSIALVDEAAVAFEKRLKAIEVWRQSALNAAITDVEGHLAKYDCELQQVSLLESDYHFGMKALLITDSNGQKYVYKRAESFPYHLYNYWLSHNDRNLSFCIQKCHSEKQAMLRSFVEVQTRVEDSRRFFYEYGRLIGFSVLFGIADLHCENVVISRDTPVPIDLEFALYPFPNIANSFDIEFTGLIEPNRAGAGRRLSALYGGGVLAEWCDPYLAGEAKVSFFRTVDIKNNRATSEDEELLNPIFYKPYIQDGFVYFIEDALERIEEVVYWFQTAWQFNHRHLYSPSVFYRLVLTEGAFLGFEKARVLFRRRLLYTRTLAVESEVLGSEISQLAMGDIPIFLNGRSAGAIRGGEEELYIRRLKVLQDRGVKFLRNQLTALLDTYDRDQQATAA